MSKSFSGKSIGKKLNICLIDANSSNQLVSSIATYSKNQVGLAQCSFTSAIFQVPGIDAVGNQHIRSTGKRPNCLGDRAEVQMRGYNNLGPFIPSLSQTLRRKTGGPYRRRPTTTPINMTEAVAVDDRLRRIVLEQNSQITGRHFPKERFELGEPVSR